MKPIKTYPNSDLEVIGGLARWNRADTRRTGFHNLHRIVRYCSSIRAAEVMKLEKKMCSPIAQIDSVLRLTSLPWFSAMVVIRDNDVLYERYANDFGPDRPHSVQSITKTTMNLIIGQLLEQRKVDLSDRISKFIPEIGSGYSEVSVQQVLNMDVVNSYTEDYADRSATYFTHEEALGWRLSKHAVEDQCEYRFLATITSNDVTNRSGFAQYKDANTAVLGWVAERVSGRSLRDFLVDIVSEAGLEHCFYITTDRLGFPMVEGGACFTARDLARYLSIFARSGVGITGKLVGNPSFIRESQSGGTAMRAPFEGIRYNNHLMVRNQFIGHGGWGGQYGIVNMETGIIAVFLSVLENEHAITRDYLAPVVSMLEEVTCFPISG
jgi:CubicO group peptidase (beta-lactamase class C family)